MVDRSLEDFLAVVCRDLGGEDASIVDDEDTPRDAIEPTTSLTRPLAGGRTLVVRFVEPPSDLEARGRRLDMLVDSFRDLLTSPVRPSRPPPARSLHDELAALATRAGARDALVIDARSPVVWGTAGEDREAETAQIIPYTRKRTKADDEVLRVGRRYGVSPVFELLSGDPAITGLMPRAFCERGAFVPLAADEERVVLAMADPGDLDAIHDAALATGLRVEPVAAPATVISAFVAANVPASIETYEAARERLGTAEREAAAVLVRDAWARHLASRRAVPAVRALPELPTLHRGGHLLRTHSEPGFGYIARSFAGIYVLVLVYDTVFDELLAKRATVQALPTIERLVLALPPRDPATPRGGAAVALRPRRRRR